MGEFRKYRPYYACNALRFNAREKLYYDGYSNNKADAMTRVPNFKDINGTEYGWLLNMNAHAYYGNNSTTTSSASGISIESITLGTVIAGNYEHFTYLTPYATSDKLVDYSIDDYDYRPNIAGVTYFQRAQYVAQDVNKILYSMSIFNDNVDVYNINDAPNTVIQVWSQDTFYEKVGDNYILTTSQPTDWNDNIGDGKYGYNQYYTLHEAEDIEVSCIKFRKVMAASSNTSRSYANATATESNQVNILTIYCSYFLDHPVTIHAGDSYLLSLSFESSQF